jgi:hypothetical protein
MRQRRQQKIGKSRWIGRRINVALSAEFVGFGSAFHGDLPWFYVQKGASTVTRPRESYRF